ncbi:hypothetical protein BC833DRAFT_592184 [Globomyces pollinis-pini]|nr:hypothetical protein BC833DRAFT_592184 [Globomyces pollinis-pini]
MVTVTELSLPSFHDPKYSCLICQEKFIHFADWKVHAAKTNHTKTEPELQQIPVDSISKTEDRFQFTFTFGKPEDSTTQITNTFGTPKDSTTPITNTFGTPKESTTPITTSFGTPKESTAPITTAFATTKESTAPITTGFGTPNQSNARSTTLFVKRKQSTTAFVKPKLSSAPLFGRPKESTIPTVSNNLSNSQPKLDKQVNCESLDLTKLCVHDQVESKPQSIEDLLSPRPFTAFTDANSLTLITEERTKEISQYGFLAQTEDNQKIYMNTAAPFCLVAVGVQGAGKSHSVATIIENCMLSVPNHIHRQQPTSTLVFHYDQDLANMCEAVTLTSRRPGIPNSISPVSHMSVLVSPSFYIQRKAYYDSIPNCTVYPLLFKWKELNASQIKAIMRVDVGENIPLYMSSILTMLRRLQKQGKMPDFARFKDLIKAEMKLTDKQTSPLDLRLSLLESLLQESNENKHFPKTDLKKIFSDPSLVVVDLTDPMMSPTEANGIFQVLLAMFLNTSGPKLAVFDEAHKYLDSSTSPLSLSIITSVRQMRHHGLRIVVSSQSPKSIPAEILDLSTLCLVHRFIAHDWFTYLQMKIHMEPERYKQIMELQTGQALLFYAKWSSVIAGTSSYVVPVSIRGRITMDGGRSK